MLRKARIDAPGSTQQIIFLGMERKSNFTEAVGCNHIAERLGRILNVGSKKNG